MNDHAPVRDPTSLPLTDDKGIFLKQQLKDKPTEHKQYIGTCSEDLPEIRNWKWGSTK